MNSPRALNYAARTGIHQGLQSSVMGYSTLLKPETALNILQRVLIFAFQTGPPHASRLSPSRFPSTSRVACWISILPFGLTESQTRPPSISHFLLFLAIKSYFLSAVFAHDASVMLMKIEEPLIGEQRGGDRSGVVAHACLVRALKGQGKDCCTYTNLDSFSASNHT